MSYRISKAMRLE